MRGRVRTMGFHMIVLAAVIFAATGSRAAADETNYNGHYELADAKAGRTFSLDVKQTRSRADVTFSAAMNDGSGSAPDGEGKGEVEDGVLSFSFTDGFKNEGTATLGPGKGGGYSLSMVVIKVVDPGPFHFYGTVLLKKTSDKAQ